MTKITIVIEDIPENADKATISCHVEGSPTDTFQRLMRGENVLTEGLTSAEGVATVMLMSTSEGDDPNSYLDSNTEGMILN